MQTLTDLSKLNPLQRIILVYNGTLTKLLENLLGEQLIVVKLHESIDVTLQEIPLLNLLANENVMKREICLQGKNSGVNWLHAESLIVPERLPALFREELLSSQTPIGKLWTKYRVETFKELFQPFEEPAQNLAIHFDIEPNDLLLGRSYRVFSQQQPVMLLTEKFPVTYFTHLR